MRGTRGLAGVLTAVLIALTPSPAAQAAGPPPPGQTRSHYLTSVDPALLARTGSADAADAEVQGLAQALVVLDAGSPNGTDGSVRLPDTHTPATPAQVKKAVIAYGKAWAAAGGPQLVLVVGTTNYGAFSGGPHGSAWAALVDEVATALPGIDVRGGLDAEQEYSGPTATRSWVEAYDAGGTRPYVDFGSCTCPPAPDPPANGWTTEDVYAVAVGDGTALVLPEIYSPKGGNARARGRLVTWAKAHHPELPVHVVGAMTEVGACVGPPKRACKGIDAGAPEAWTQLTGALKLTTDVGPDLRYLTDISYLPVPAVRHTGTTFGAPLVIGLLVLVGGLGSTAVLALVHRRRGGVTKAGSRRARATRRR